MLDSKLMFTIVTATSSV